MATILIVEDQEQILILAKSFLEEQGHKTLSAATADEALAILTGSEAVDALFVDIILNGDMQAGIELAKRAVELKPRLKVVYSTGLSVTDGMKALFVPGSAVLATSTTRLRLYESAIASCFVFSRKICDPATFDFCNTIERETDVVRRTPNVA
jgi:CheY-like chemotaxis protein